MHDRYQAATPEPPTPPYPGDARKVPGASGKNQDQACQTGAYPATTQDEKGSVDPVGQLVDEIDRDDRLVIPLADLEDSLHHVAPAEQHLAIGFGELRMRRDEGLHDGTPAGKRALQDEVVDDVDELEEEQA